MPDGPENFESPDEALLALRRAGLVPDDQDLEVELLRSLTPAIVEELERAHGLVLEQARQRDVVMVDSIRFLRTRLSMVFERTLLESFFPLLVELFEKLNGRKPKQFVSPRLGVSFFRKYLTTRHLENGFGLGCKAVGQVLASFVRSFQERGVVPKLEDLFEKFGGESVCGKDCFVVLIDGKGPRVRSAKIKCVRVEGVVEVINIDSEDQPLRHLEPDRVFPTEKLANEYLERLQVSEEEDV